MIALLFVGRNLLLAMIEQLCANSAQIESTEQVQNILLFLQNSEDLSTHLNSFLHILSSTLPKDDFSFALTPILSQQLHEADVLRCRFWAALLSSLHMSSFLLSLTLFSCAVGASILTLSLMLS